MKPEQQFSHWLRGKLPGYTDRIENTIGAGIPDIFWSCKELPGAWIETKIVTSGKILLRKEQYAWGISRSKNKFPIFIIALDKDNDVVKIWKYPVYAKLQGKYMAVETGPFIEINRPRFDYSSLLVGLT